VAREVIKQEEIVDYTYQDTVLDRFAKRLGASVAKAIGIDATIKNLQLR
jgi:protease-4